MPVSDDLTCGSDSWIPSQELEIKRRNLPHWSMDGAWYFITFRVLFGKLSEREVCIVVEHIKRGHSKYYRLIAVSVMPDHVHVILCPNAGVSLSSIIRGIKGPAARLINSVRGTIGSLWQDERWDRIIRDDSELQEKLTYMLQSPVKERLIEDPWSYSGWFFNTQ